MPRTMLMTFVPAQKRWMKKYQGKIFSVSCKQLGCEPSKKDSWLAANSWWMAKQDEIDREAAEQARKPIPGTAEAQMRLLEVWAGKPFETPEEATVALAEFMDYFKDKPVPKEILQAIIGPAKYAQIDHAVNALIDGQAAPDRTIAKQVEGWLEVLKASVATGSIDVSRFDAYKRHVGIFRDWIGGDQPVEAITAAKLEEWWAYLALKVSEKEYSPAYTKTIFMTAKQFISRLGELGLIPLPGNIRSKRFKFKDGPQKVETFTTAEVKSLLAGCDGFSERTKLYLLLMLNCGMLQADIADLGDEEVDWKKGTLARPRSKRPDGPVTRYKLWPETLALLKKFKARKKVLNDRDQARVVLTEDDNPLSRYWMEDGKMRRYDVIQSAFTRLYEKVGVSKPVKVFRKTAASKLAEHKDYKYYVHYFLSHSPKSVADKHYVAPSDAEFFQALDWLRSQFI